MKFIIGCSDVSPDGTEMHSLLSLCKTNPTPDRNYRDGILSSSSRRHAETQSISRFPRRPRIDACILLSDPRASSVTPALKACYRAARTRVTVTTRLGFAPLYRNPDTVKEAKPSASASAATESNIVLTAPVPIEAARAPSGYIARLLIVKFLPSTDTSPRTPTIISPNLKLLSTTDPSTKTSEATSAAFHAPRSYYETSRVDSDA